MIGESYAMSKLREQVAMAAPTNGRVLIIGENGTGKELVARNIHGLSRRRSTPFVEVNCAAIPEELIESELFGHVRGAFTRRGGRSARQVRGAHGGTIFLDEIGDMSSEDAGEGVARPAGTGHGASRRLDTDSRRRARAGGDEQGSAGGNPRRSVS